MINYKRYQLANGLRVLLQEDPSSPMLTLCMNYEVGSKDELPGRSGFAHLFEHLMFAGSQHAPNFDQLIQLAGGENNAFTNQDMTVFYDILPYQNLDLGLWLEADRMQNLCIEPQPLQKEKRVVVEEFKESCLEEPYGDLWHILGDLAFEEHPYKRPVIGESFEHIEAASLDEVREFYDNYYCPNNAVLSISGNIKAEEVLERVEHWFGHIPRGPVKRPAYAAEPPQLVARKKVHRANVTDAALYIAFPAAARLETAYYLEDLLSDILGLSDSSLLVRQLVKQQKLFSELDVYITGTVEAGLFVIEGKLQDGVGIEEAEQAVWAALEEFKAQPISEEQLQKLQNNTEHNLLFGEIRPFQKALSLGYYELLGQAQLINEEADYYQQITAKQLQLQAQFLFQKEKASVLYYLPNN